MSAPRSIDEYLKQLRAALEGQDPALIQDALYDAEEYLRAEVAAHPDKSEADVLELIASTYGAPDEVASAYRDTEAKVKAALKTPMPAAAASASGWKRFFGVYLDPRSFSLVKIAALIALDAPPTSYLWQVANALDSGCTPEDLVGVLKAIAPQVGGPRVVAAAPEIMVALGLALPEGAE